MIWQKPLPDKIGWGLAGLLYLAFSVWIFSFPPSIGHDDAFFFAQGIERFSVLEFRPHFPGYPGFILWGKLIAAITGLEAEKTLWLLSNICILLIPPFAVLAVSKNRLAAFLLALTCPLLPLVGVSMMSDGAGMMIFLASVALYRSGLRQYSGVLLGVMLAVRPSFLVVAGVFILCDLVANRFRRWDMAVSGAVTCLAFFIAVFAIEGPAYIWEGWRFIEGHFTLWGNTRLHARETGWLDLSATPIFALYLGLIIAAIIYIVRLKWREISFYDPVLGATIAAWGWTILFQNPENLRHLLLPVMLGVILFVPYLSAGRLKFISCALVLCAVLLSAPYLEQARYSSPLEQANQLLQKSEIDCVLTNRGVAYLGANLTRHHVFDAYYDYVITRPCYRLSGDAPVTGAGLNIFFGRVFGEPTLYLFDLE